MAILNRQKVLNPYIIDIDTYDKKDYLGETLIHRDANAVNNTIMAYLLTKKGSYLYRPNYGSPLDILEFKNLDIIQFSNFAQRIAQSIQSEFSAYIRDVVVTLFPDYETRTIEVNFRYTSNLTNSTISNVLVKKVNTFKYQNEKSYITVELEKDNLIRWIQTEVMNQPKDVLTYIPLIQSWVWNNYKLVNLGEAGTTTWKTIQEIIFEYNSKVNGVGI
jgi:phage baseplate assembly protein W